jgi:hypothetical protein
MARRVVIGQQNDGSYGVRVSAPGFDALTVADDGHTITFDSRWNDIAKIHAIGIIPWNLNAWSFTDDNGHVFFVPGFAVTWPNPGYKPFLETRRAVSSVVYDDYWDGAAPMGNPATIFADGFRIGASSSFSSNSVIYIAYKIPVPTQ